MDPFAQALYDRHFEEQRGPLVSRRGEETREHDLGLYFETRSPGDADGEDPLERWLDGPLLDMGAGVGRHALYFQDAFETVAIEHHEELVEVMDDRGVRDARQVDMFSLRENFERDRFRSAMAVGTQVSLSRSIRGLREFLGDLAYVTAPDGTAVIDGFDPDHEDTRAKLDYYDDPTPGMAYRLLQFEYDGQLGEPWLYRLFTPDRIRDATAGTGWRVADVHYGEGDWEKHFQVALEKE